LYYFEGIMNSYILESETLEKNTAEQYGCT